MYSMCGEELNLNAAQQQLRPCHAHMWSSSMEELIQRFEKELETVMKFWLRHSHDNEHG